MTDQELNPPAVALGTASVASDLMCLSCGYNLRGLSRSGCCPECGHEVEKTIIARRGMTKRELAALAFRITALWSTLSLLTSIISGWRFFFSGPFEPVTVILTIGVATLPLALLWWKAEFLAVQAIAKDGPVSISGRFMPEQVMSVAFGIIGVLYVIYAITGAGFAAAVMISQQPNSYPLTSFMYSGLNLLIGVVMLIGAGRIARFVIWLRTVGTIKETD